MIRTKKRHQLDMCHGSLADKILLFAIPLMASSMLQLLFNAADVIVVGRFAGKESLAAVGSTTSLINLLVALFVGLSVGSNVVVARNLGGKRHDMVGRAVHTSILMALVSGAILAVFGFFAARQLLVWMSSPADVIDKSAIYLRIYFLGMPATMAYNFGAAILRAQGDTKRPLYFLIIAGVVNVILNLISVILLNMDVAGVALATTISQYVSAGLVILCLTKEDGPLRLNLKAMKLDRHILGQILEIGLPAGFQGIVFSLSNVLIQSSINSFGSTVVAGSAAAGNIENFVYQAMNAFYQTNLTFTGQNYGAGECRRVDKTLLYCQGFVIVTGLLLGNLVYYFGHPLVSIYAPGEEDVIRQGIIRLGYVARPYALCGIMDTMVGSLRGLGYSIGPMIVSLIGACGLRVAWIFTIFQMYRTPVHLLSHLLDRDRRSPHSVFPLCTEKSVRSGAGRLPQGGGRGAPCDRGAVSQKRSGCGGQLGRRSLFCCAHWKNLTICLNPKKICFRILVFPRQRNPPCDKIPTAEWEKRSA